MNHPEAFTNPISKDKVLDWIKSDSSLKGLSDKLTSVLPQSLTPKHLQGDVQKKIATSLLKDQAIVRLIKEGKTNTPEFQQKVLQKTLDIVKTDPEIKADFARKVFSRDRFGMTLNED